jgi:hypothetical protein
MLAGLMVCSPCTHGRVVDPMFCDPEICDVGLLPGSPCLPGNHGGYECSLIGAYGEGCGQIPAREITWGGIKTLFR